MKTIRITETAFSHLLGRISEDYLEILTSAEAAIDRAAPLEVDGDTEKCRRDAADVRALGEALQRAGEQLLRVSGKLEAITLLQAGPGRSR